MSSKNRLRVALVALVVGLTGLATAGPAMAATQPATSVAARAQQDQAPLIPTAFVDLPTSDLQAHSDRHKIKVTYTNDTAADLTVAPQLLVSSPDAGPFLEPTDVTVQHRTADGCWETVQLGTQTGTLFTDLPTAQRTLHPGETLTEVYRLTVLDSAAKGTVQPRIALYG
ncbi:signal peptide protein [Streptomyces lincolnensis]|uniref:hypothetical protein n=1 Tax=Streptomyces lincolnensis TaxID=1915 RepID=UPI001E59C057|nr:hypothetical protein [Streptomyces lincolnensis]MCD7440465.1 signal peptide protein [Streptomyces lincolnensis]